METVKAQESFNPAKSGSLALDDIQLGFCQVGRIAPQYRGAQGRAVNDILGSNRPWRPQLDNTSAPAAVKYSSAFPLSRPGELKKLPRPMDGVRAGELLFSIAPSP